MVYIPIREITLPVTARPIICLTLFWVLDKLSLYTEDIGKGWWESGKIEGLYNFNWFNFLASLVVPNLFTLNFSLNLNFELCYNFLLIKLFINSYSTDITPIQSVRSLSYLLFMIDRILSNWL